MPANLGQRILFALADWLGLNPSLLEEIIHTLNIPWPWAMG